MRPARVGVVSDTHGLVRPGLLRGLAGVDAILHAGDVGGDAVLEALRALAPVHAVRGNTDGPGLPERLELTLFGWAFGLEHGHLVPARDRARRLAERMPGARVVVYGHTHVAALETLEVGGRAVTALNPGACGPRRFGQALGAGVLELTPEALSWRPFDPG